ncbi:50S ribosomal protein L14 [Candidatus Kuenenbacteria bacterium CG23_combo_of_CG06-09_8_20_14_all_36_9]|uniref:Large ribosomal subunit protein uL14 n=1 Tax=Candidatus Kuenenbacteria bacterium CG10_big_fil_rev_8_21_14_0_10_36_11 TaxID=1974618 RepID=A0A2M6W9P5_9BACT|nr:MAG: 50S ribosomal protein L14 [Candidatus Kuenenbacteria bacterium CG23_combo_of_CG06-09_8_20_14_all_36_9]PIT89542.1 MAG: 50S ribosomal protein L14 [Candidatus Kuenenbacteria bacterium CG10_big_fil_rev_8_21_14_0_10_36_11]
MLQLRSMLNSADNTGAKKLQLIHIAGSHGQRFAHIGEIIVCAIKESAPHSQVKKGDVVKAVIVRTKKEVRRPSGIYIRFDDNAAVIIDPKTKEPKGTRILGPVARELRARGFMKIISLAPEVL